MKKQLEDATEAFVPPLLSKCNCTFKKKVRLSSCRMHYDVITIQIKLS